MSLARKALAAALALAAACGAEGAARANGRLPYATELVLEPGEGGAVAIRTTFGILRSAGRGQRFDWICEQVAGGVEALDPGVGMFRGGRLAVASFRGLAVGTADGCAFPLVPGDLADRYVIDVTVDEGTGSRAVAVTTARGGSAEPVRVFRSDDRGETWVTTGDAVLGLVRATTLETAPSRFQRLYVAGSVVSEGGRLTSAVAVSDDGGATFRAGHEDPSASALFLSAVDPTDPDRVYAVAYGAESDRLLVSKDGGLHFEVAKTLVGRVKGLALSPDGARVAVGGDADGVWVADRDTLAFQQTSPTPVMCLRWTRDALWACGTARGDAFVLARSDDEGAHFTPVLARIDDVAGPAECPSDAPVARTCTDATWAGVTARVGGLSQPDAGPRVSEGADAADERAAPVTPRATSGCEATPRGPATCLPLCLAAVSALAFAAARRRRARTTSRP